MKKHTMMGLLLILSGLMLAVLVPGGPVENRDFSHIQPLILALFNIFLTTLGLGSLLLGIAAFKRPINTLLPLLAGVAYIGVYLLDLLSIFPISPTPMSHALWSIETTGLVLAIALLGTASSLVGQAAPRTVPTSKQLSWALVPLLIAGAGIVVLATCAAMGVCPSDVQH